MFRGKSDVEKVRSEKAKVKSFEERDSYKIYPGRQAGLST